MYIIFKASQPRGRASGSCAYERHEMQGVIIKCTCSVFVNLRPHLLHICSRHQFSSPERNRLPLWDSNPHSSVYQTERITTLPRGRPEHAFGSSSSVLFVKPPKSGHPLGQERTSLLGGCPHFRGQNVHMHLGERSSILSRSTHSGWSGFH